MNDEELTIGDILMAHFNDGESEFDFPVVVDGVDSNCTLVDGTCSLSWTPVLKEHSDIEYAEDIKPIHLAEEILEANGFECITRDLAYIYMVKRGDGYVIEIYLLRNNDVINVEHSYQLGNEYVMDRVHKCGLYFHELQHALRLCGLTELANNLKIK